MNSPATHETTGQVLHDGRVAEWVLGHVFVSDLVFFGIIAIMRHQSYIQQYGTSYYLANLFFPRQLQQAVMTLYAYVRIPDNIVDDTTIQDSDALAQIEEYQASFGAAYAGTSEGSVHHELLRDTAQLFHDYEIPLGWSDDFLAAMKADTHTKRYDSYEQLQ